MTGKLYLDHWRDAFPEAEMYAPPGLAKKRTDLSFDGRLPAGAEAFWTSDIENFVFEGSPIMEEVVFFHRLSKTLILGDPIENFPQNHFSGFRKTIAKMTGILSPNGKTPLDWRLSFVFGKRKARQSVRRMLSLNPENIVLAHGECIVGGAKEALERSFDWV